MSFTMTDAEWDSYKKERLDNYGIKNERLRPAEQDIFEWLAEDESEEEKAEAAKIMKMCAEE